MYIYIYISYSLNPGYTKAYYRRASANFALGRSKEAKKDFEAVIKIAPNDVDASKKLKACKQAIREEAFLKAIESDNDSSTNNIDLDKIMVESSYVGPKLESGVENPVTLEFVLQLMETFKLQQKLIHHTHDDELVQGFEADDGIQTVAELWGEKPFDIGHFIPSLPGIGETNGGFVHRLGTRIGGHDDDHVAEVGLAPVVIGQGAMVHDLQQDIEHIRMGLLDLIQEQHRMRLFGDRFGEQSTLVKTHISRGSTYQTADRMALHVLRHVKADQLDAHDEGELFGCFGFAHTGGAAEEEGADGFIRLAQTRARHLDR
jgi:hypothetical protein